MIPMMNIVAWGKTVPWVKLRQVEQDLVICRALVEVFNDPFLREQLRVRGGTALNKLHFPKYLEATEQSISRAEAEQRMFAKLEDPSFLADVRPLLSADEAEKFDDETVQAAFSLVFSELIKRIPGKPWAQSTEMAKKFGMPD